MDLNLYQAEAKQFAVYPEQYGLLYTTLGLCGETGEFAEKIKKQIRDGKFDKEAAIKELGDILWYLANCATELGVFLDFVAEKNLQKLHDRKQRDVLKGSGDNR